MRIRVDLGGVASRNSPKAKLRESTRMAMLAWCLRYIGQDVCIDNPPPELTASNRYDTFAHLRKRSRGENFNVEVFPFERSPLENIRSVKVGFKTSVGCGYDQSYLRCVDVLMAHEYDPKIDKSQRLMPIPFNIHDLSVQHFFDIGLIENYMRDDLHSIRSHFNPTGECDGTIGFIGENSYNRMECLLQLPLYCKYELYNGTPPYETPFYLSLLSKWRAGIEISGDTPKTNRFAELALFGIPVINVPITPNICPPLTTGNSIMLRDWGDLESLEVGLGRSGDVRQQADCCYLEGWSPLAQSKRLVERIVKS